MKNKKHKQDYGIFNGWGNAIFLILVLAFVGAFFCGLLIPIFVVPILDVSNLNWAFKIGGGALILITIGISFIKFHLHSFFAMIFKWIYQIIFRKIIGEEKDGKRK